MLLVVDAALCTRETRGNGESAGTTEKCAMVFKILRGPTFTVHAFSVDTIFCKLGEGTLRG